LTNVCSSTRVEILPDGVNVALRDEKRGGTRGFPRVDAMERT
jgi:hypothetical protein